MWDYIYFYIHLERIDINDHNAIESYVYKQVLIFKCGSLLIMQYILCHRLTKIKLISSHCFVPEV